MNRPEILFAYRKVLFNGEWHLRCINCGIDHADSWNWNERWALHVSSTDRVISASLPSNDCETSGIPRGPAMVYGIDPIIEATAFGMRVPLIVAQNHVVVITKDDCTTTSLPSFISNEPRTLAKVRLVMEFSSKYVGDLPEVQAFERQTGKRDRENDLELFESRHTKTPMPIPPGLLLPATAHVGYLQVPVVYSVDKWVSGNRAVIECFVSNNRIRVGQGAILKRTFNSSDREQIEVTLGTVV